MTHSFPTRRSSDLHHGGRLLMDEGPTWTIREAGESDAPALALIGAATFLETFAGIIDGAAILGHCAAPHSAAAYRDHLAAGPRPWLPKALPGGAPTRYAARESGWWGQEGAERGE